MTQNMSKVRYIRIIFIWLALYMGAANVTWAQTSSCSNCAFSIATTDIKITPSGKGTVTVESIVHNTTEGEHNGEHTVTIVVEPVEGYCLKIGDIRVRKLVAPSSLPTPARAIAPEIADDLTVHGSSVVINTTSPANKKFTFTVPSGYDGAYIEAEFKDISEMYGGVIITEGGISYDANGHYILLDDVDVSTSGGAIFGTQSSAFTGIFEGVAKDDGSYPKIKGLTSALFDVIDGGTVKNIVLDDVTIGGSTTIESTDNTINGKTATGAIANVATGTSRIYNCGIQATGSTVKTNDDGYTEITDCSSYVGSNADYVGGLVGLLDGTARVINCYSYADITSGSYVGGIVGYNNGTTTSANNNQNTMVMNCMFYGNITSGNKAPIYNGKIISNAGSTGVGNYNYFYSEASYAENREINTANCALMAEGRFLQRFEFFRHLLNSHLELAGWWATDAYDKIEMAKWVLEPSQIGSSTPYPILKKPGRYHSVVNIDNLDVANHRSNTIGTSKGTLTVNIQMGDGAVYERPSGAAITTQQLSLNITDKDPDHFNFNYHKVQLPYYNDVGTKNYNGNRVVTGWKIVSITGGTPGSFTTSDAWGGYNFADRNCTNKDLYGTGGSNRIFNQGAYWDVPEGVTAITIEPYWAKCAYLADPNADKVYSEDMATGYNVSNVGGGSRYTNGSSYSIAGENQVVYTSIGNAIASSALYSEYTEDQRNSQSVYDYAVVLVGNYHHYFATNKMEASKAKPYTVTSIDLDGDNEPDYSYILRFDGRAETHPVRADFINIPGLGMAQKSNGGTGSYNFGILIPKGWYESTNTSLLRFTQFEYEHSSRSTTDALILQGGVMEQWVSNNQKGTSNKIPYIHVGGNVWFKEFHTGCHQDKQIATKHSPISVTGGDYDEFYLTGLYRGDITNKEDNAECYINGGRFGTVCGAAMEGIGKANGASDTGNITWLIQNADIHEFYAGGLNAAKPVTGNLSTTIVDSHVDIFCGGPKFGDMSANKTVVTNATGCTFGTFFGAGYGGNSYSRYAPTNQNNVTNINWNNWVRGQYTRVYDATYGGVSTQFNYQFLPMSDNKTNVARILVDFVKFSLATTHGVTSTLERCTIENNFYGGGNLGKVDGDVTSTLTDCTVNGNVFGAGYSASLPTVEVDNIGFETEPFYYTDFGTYRKGVKGATTTYTWKKKDGNSWVDNTNHILYTTADLTTLGTVTGTATLTINGTTTVAESVYGGGEESSVGGEESTDVGNTVVIINNGTIGTQGQGGATYGNVYGGGKGKARNEGNEDYDDLTLVKMGLVKGNTNVTINGGTILHNVYGGGAFGSVGNFTFADAAYNTAHSTTLPLGTIVDYTDGGTANVTITGGTIGTTGKENGMVFGSSRGDVETPTGTPAIDINDCLAWVHDTHVIIGTTGQGADAPQPQIKGSVYGSGENGHTYQNTIVDIHSGTIGIASGVEVEDEDGNKYQGAAYPYRGNVFGGGCGTDKYASVANGSKDTYNPLAGIVLGTATVNIDGGLVVHNVYGAGAMGSVGTMEKNATTGAITFTSGGTTTIAISGGTVGVDGIGNGNVFGAARGDANTTQTDVALVKTTGVTISGEAAILGNVYGGGETGDVGTYTTDENDANIYPEGSGVCNVTVTGGTIGPANNTNPNRGNVFGAGKGVANSFKCLKAMAKSATVTISNGTVNGTVYGGGEIGRVEENTTVTIGAPSGTDEFTITGNVFGAGKGLDTHGYSALVRGNPVITVQGSAQVGGSVYGGGEIASVGKHSLVTAANADQHPELELGMPFTLANNSVGVCTVTVKDKAEITGNVFGAGKGISPTEITNPGRRKPDGNMEYYNNNGDANSYGPDWENALQIYVQTLALVTDTHVSIGGTTEGTDTKVLGSVYGGSESGFVQYHTNVAINENCTIGTTSVEGNVYGGGLGISGNDVAGRVGGNTKIDINNGTTHGSVYGGGAYGAVKGSVNVNINNGIIDQDVYGGGKLAHTNTAMWDDAQNALLEYAEVKNLIVDSSPVTGYYTKDGDKYTVITTENAKAEDDTQYYAVYTTTVNLLGGLINGYAYGGGRGDTGKPAYVYGDVLVDLNGTTTSRENNTGTPKNRATRGCVVDEVFGCNNTSGSPKGNVTVHVYGTQNGATSLTIGDKYTPPYYDRDKSTSEGLKAYLGRLISQANTVTPRTEEDTGITASVVADANTLLTDLAEVAEADLTDEQKANLQDAIDAVLAELDGLYDVHAVYGGGNNAAYEPVSPYNGSTGSKSQVIIEGCDYTSIQYVYGGGNAAPVPETNILIKGTKMIDYLFGGGNGTRVAANVGYKGDNTTNQGTGNVTIRLRGGKIHNLFGGSNSNGLIRGTVSRQTVSATEMPAVAENADCCATMEINRIYSAGKNADIEGDLIDVLDCMPGSWVDEYYGGAENANVKGNVELTITGGYFRKLFGGNKTSGAIFGHIKLNIEETADCNPIVIDELYGCGNDAAYSVYGYKQEGTDENGKPIYTVRTSSDDGNPVHFGDGGEDDHTMPPYDDPEINIISCTRIGQVYGGGYGSNATVYGNPKVNIDMIQGSHVAELSGTSKLGEIGGIYTDANSQQVKGGVFGGGNAADVYGDATVNVCSNTTVKLHVKDASGVISLTSENYPVLGANIAGDVYGGGREANVTGNTYVNICAEEDDDESTTDVIEYKGVTINDDNDDFEGVIIKGNVFGGGKGITEDAGVTGAFECAKAMVGVVNTNNGTVDITKESTNRGTRVSIGNGTVTGTVYGGGEVGRVEWNGVVTIGLPVGTGETSAPEIQGNVFGGGKGVEQYGYAALLRGNTFVTVQANAKVGKSVYGGGEIASVGKYNITRQEDLDNPTFMEAHPGIGLGMPWSLGNEKSGYCTVIVRGNAEIGPDNMQMTKAGGPDDEGHVFGGGKGILPYENENDFECQIHTGEKHPGRMSKGDVWQCYYNSEDPDDDSAYLRFIETQALATHTEVLVGGNAFVKGSVYGGSLSGHVQHDTHVTIAGDCQIGAGEGINKRYTEHYNVTNWPIDTEDITTSWAECAHWTFNAASAPYDPYAKYLHEGKYYYDEQHSNYANGGSYIATDGHTYYGNVFGGGSGVIPYKPGKWHREAGTVGGNTVVDITGGHILTSVYGGNEHTDVGTYDPSSRALLAGTGKCTINMTGGTVGVPRTKTDIALHPVTCYVFGAGKGDSRVVFNKWTNVGETEVNISGNARIYGSTFGGGEDGHVLGDAKTNIGGSVDLNGDGDTTDDGETSTAPNLIIGTQGLSGADGNIFGGGRGFSEDALTAGVVCGNVTVNIYNGKMLGSVFGGGRLASVGTHLAGEGAVNYGKLIPEGKNQVIGSDDVTATDATHGHINVNIDGGTIGATDSDGKLVASDYSIGDVFGGCKGSASDKRFGLAKYTTITMTGGQVNGNVYGGGELGCVGASTYHDDTKVYSWAETDDGLCTVNISGGKVGVDGNTNKKKGNVFGAGKGKDDTFECEKALVRATSVTISNDGTVVNGNVYGGGEIGRVDQNTVVTIGSGTSSGAGTSGGKDVVITGNVFGAGAGVETHGYSALVRGNSTVTIQGNAKVDHSVYGGGEIAAVGRYSLDSDNMPEQLKSGGDCRVNVKGYAIIGSGGVGDVFGAGMGVNPFDDAHKYIDFTTPTVRTTKPKRMTLKPAPEKMPDLYDNVGDGSQYIWEYYTSKDDYFKFLQTLALATDTYVTIEGNATVNGSVYGGSESGFVQRETDVKIQGSSKIVTTQTDTNGKPKNGHVFGGGKGVSGFDKAGRVRGNASTTISGSGTVNGNVYGGGELGFVGKFSVSPNGRNYDWQKITNQNNQEETTGLCTVLVNSATAEVKGDVFGAGKGEAITFKCEPAMTRTTSVSITNGTVGGNVYGGGEVGRVDQDTRVTIGNPTGSSAPHITGSVFGAGAGLATHGYSALVRGNTYVTVQNHATVGHSVYGGGEIASVGKYGLDDQKMPSVLLGGGYCYVTVKGDAAITGDVFGAGQGITPAFDKTNTDRSNRSRRMTMYNADDFPSTAMLPAISGEATGKTKQGTTWEYYESGSPYVWEYFLEEADYLTYLETLALATHPEVTIEGNATIGNDVYGGGERGITKGSVIVNIKGGTITRDVYGGGALANTNTTSTVGEEDYDTGVVTTSTVHPTTTVNLLGGIIENNAYGGGLGEKPSSTNANGIKALVYGDVLVELNKGVAENAKGCVVDRVFGANNVYGTPKGHVKVHVYATQNKDLTNIKAKKDLDSKEIEDLTASDFDVIGVFGGGQSADYEPTDTKQSTEVIIEGCGLTSIYEVYGGGYGASTPGTDVLVNGTKIINKLFGGGYGAGEHEDKTDPDYNPGANVGYLTNGTPYGIGVDEDGDIVDEKTKIAIVQLKAGKVNSVFGGSNSKGDIRNGASITTLTSEEAGTTTDPCDVLTVGELYGGGNEAVMEGGAEIVLRCMPDSWIGEVYAGARKADVGNDVSLTITSGKFEHVFGGNKSDGEIDGYVEVNIEECPTCNTPVVIGELYGGGNEAPYTYSNLNNDPDYQSPRVNVRAFTSIGAIYGGGKGKGAVVTGNPTVYVNVGMVDGGGQTYPGETREIDGKQVQLYSHDQGKIGVIGDVFGGGNAAKVNGSTNVFIGTESYVKLDRIVAGETDVSNYYIRTGTSPNYVYTQVPRTKAAEAGTYYKREQTGAYTPVSVSAEDDISGYYIRYGEGSDDDPFVYTPVSPAQEGTIYCLPVLGADIQGNVYGGGNAAEVTGNTNVVIGKETVTP